MPFLPLDLPPGVVRPGSVYQAKGRWYDTSLMRWFEGAMQPIGGWSQLIAAASVGSKPVRSMFSWRIDSGISRLALGTYQKFYVYDGETGAATTTDVTPSASFTAGASDDAKYAWHIDNFGGDLLAVLPRDPFASNGDGKLWRYDSLNPTTAMAVAHADAPIGLLGVCVTPENFAFCLGAGGNPRKIQWPDQAVLDTWTPSDDNQAGDFTLQTNGKLLAGRRARKETLLWTDVDLWAAEYINEELVYGFSLRGSQCGAMSPRSMALVDGKAIWMGKNGFFIYDGYVRPLTCEVGDYIFGKQPTSVSPVNAGIDRSKSHWVFCVPNTQFGEVTWYYVSQGSSGTGTENDRYVTYNYVLDCWYIGALARTGGIEDGGAASFGRPVLGGTTGAVFQHEIAATDEDEWGDAVPYATSGPVELGAGDNLMTVLGWIPDSKSLGQWQVTLFTANHPTASETTVGPFTAANPTDIRTTARQARIKVEAVDGSTTHRFGTPRLNVVPRGKR